MEPNADPTGQTVGSKLIVDGTHQFSDLDELIVNHVQAMARKVEELMMHEKFKPGTEDDLRAYDHRLTVASADDAGYCRSLPQELRCCEPVKECLWFHPQPQAAWTLQPLLSCQQKLNSADMGMSYICPGT